MDNQDIKAVLWQPISPPLVYTLQHEADPDPRVREASWIRILILHLLCPYLELGYDEYRDNFFIIIMIFLQRNMV